MAKRGLYYDLVRQQEKHSVQEENALRKFEQHGRRSDNSDNSAFADGRNENVQEDVLPKSNQFIATNSSANKGEKYTYANDSPTFQYTADSKNTSSDQKHRTNMSQG